MWTDCIVVGKCRLNNNLHNHLQQLQGINIMQPTDCPPSSNNPAVAESVVWVGWIWMLWSLRLYKWLILHIGWSDKLNASLWEQLDCGAEWLPLYLFQGDDDGDGSGTAAVLSSSWLHSRYWRNAALSMCAELKVLWWRWRRKTVQWVLSTCFSSHALEDDLAI